MRILKKTFNILKSCKNHHLSQNNICHKGQNISMIKNKKEIDKIKIANNSTCMLNELNCTNQNEELVNNEISKKENVLLNNKNSNSKVFETKNTKKSNLKCKIHVMPPAISDADINALFSGLVSIVRRKIELEARAEIINININNDKLTRALKAKQAECVRLKNELLQLKSKQDSMDNP